MTRRRADLPQLKPGLFVSDGGMETTLIFHEGVDLPHFASFVLLDSEEGRARLRAYYERYLAIARRHGRGLILDSPTWRANPDWGAKLGYDAAGLKRINEASIALLDELRQAWETAETPIVVAGVIGPRGDGYAEGRMSAAEAEDYHAPQIASFAETLDSGDPIDLGRRYRRLRETYPGLRILGGCCGTDDRHVAAICEACV